MASLLVLCFLFIGCVFAIIVLWRRKKRRIKKRRTASNITPQVVSRRPQSTLRRTTRPVPTPKAIDTEPSNLQVIKFLGYCQKGKIIGIVLLFPGPISNMMLLSIVTTGDYKTADDIPAELLKKLRLAQGLMEYDHHSPGHQALLVVCSIAEIELAIAEFNRLSKLTEGFRCYIDFLRDLMKAPEVEELVMKVFGAVDTSQSHLGGSLGYADTGKSGGFIMTVLNYIYNPGKQRPVTRLSIYAMSASSPAKIEAAQEAVAAVKVKEVVHSIHRTPR